jgi:hypothetical protein
MKTLSAILMVTLTLLIGCDNSPDLSVNYSGNTPQASLSKITEYELIPLPAKSPLWMDSVFTMSKVIDGAVGGRMILEKYYISEDGDSIITKADLRIPEGAFQGTETITMTVDDEYAAVHFYPSMVFDDTLRLFQSFEGLNLEEYPTGTIDFVYLADDGSVELVKKNGLQVVKPQGIVRVQNAKLLHFSRYGWVRKPAGLEQVYPDIKYY